MGIRGDGNTPMRASTKDNRDIRRLTLVQGPINGLAGSPTAAGVWAIRPELGPTGLAVSRLTRTDQPIGWGLYTASTHNGQTIPIGSIVQVSFWVRASSTYNANVEIINDPASERVTATQVLSFPSDWQKVMISMNVVNYAWTSGGSRKLRFSGPPIIGEWVEISDVIVHVQPFLP